MSSKIKCPICGSELKVLNSRHINSKKHQKALKTKGISRSNDPTLDLIKKRKSTRKASKSSVIKNLEGRLNLLEEEISAIKKSQKIILKVMESANLISPKYSTKTDENKKSLLKASTIESAIKKCVQNNQNRSIWVKIDDVISILKLNQEKERSVFNRLLIKMFNKNVVDLAEGGDPKYPLKFQNREYGMVALQ
jgi:hypothetical protein